MGMEGKRDGDRPLLPLALGQIRPQDWTGQAHPVDEIPWLRIEANVAYCVAPILDLISVGGAMFTKIGCFFRGTDAWIKTTNDAAAGERVPVLDVEEEPARQNAFFGLVANSSAPAATRDKLLADPADIRR